MTILKTLAAAALLSALTATPVFAQAAIQEPGVFAFYHPNLDVLNGGRAHSGRKDRSAGAMALHERSVSRIRLVPRVAPSTASPRALTLTIGISMNVARAHTIDT